MCAAMVGTRLSALRLPFLRMILSENRTPRFGIMRRRVANLFSVRSRRQARARGVARTIFRVVFAGLDPAIHAGQSLAGTYGVV
jgi:hypothetical protein